jgi:hypothetical protein
MLDVGRWTFVAGSDAGAVAKIAVARSFHDRLRPLEFDIRVEPGDHAAVAVAREKCPNVFQPQPAVHFREAAARDVELERLLVAAQDIQAQRFILAPSFDDGFEMGQIVAAQCRRGRAAALARQLFDYPGEDCAGALLANLRRERPQERCDDARLNFTSL